jgi:carotenoid cleavage dioxygenase-like enzyme
MNSASDAEQSPFQALKKAIFGYHETTESEAIRNFIHKETAETHAFRSSAFVIVEIPHPDHHPDEPPVKGHFPIDHDGTVLRNGTVKVNLQDDDSEWHHSEAEVYADDDLYDIIKTAE